MIMQSLAQLRKQRGMISIFVSMMILTLMFISAFILINYLRVFYKESATLLKKQQALDAAISGMDYAQNLINQDKSLITNQTKNGNFFYTKKIPSFITDIHTKIQIKNIKINDYNLIEIQSIAQIDDQSIIKKVNAQFFYQNDYGLSAKGINQGKYVMIPGSWRDF
ncbi:hypothetical protein L3V83_06855 [Thiotrichales bacterium 19X7-9]|nr:hypothetical protein [Thiotrichales bacterium 19X7-9]